MIKNVDYHIYVHLLSFWYHTSSGIEERRNM